MDNNKNEKINILADLLFPDISETIDVLKKKFPERNIDKNSEVTRFAPSPTGFLHTGSLFTALVSFLTAKTTNGVFYIRLEDTDTKRKVENSENSFLKELKIFNIIADEGIEEGGKYAPYKQSERIKIYHTVIKELIKKELAYVCFCTAEDLDEIRDIQKANKQITGYYGNYARCRYLSIDEVINRVKNNEHYVIRFKSNGNHENKIKLYDEIRKFISIAENDIDIVILKKDGLPTYHFAHVVDDHFMHTTTVIRGEEWISSFPIHAQLFSALNWKMPKYAHLPLISKNDNGKKRKLSKRFDPEATVNFFLQEGYPIESVLAYLMSIINNSFEEWVLKKKFKDMFSFPFSINKINLDSTLFDIKKLKFFSREFLSTISAEEMTKRVLEYAQTYDKNLEALIQKDKKFFTQIMNIERNQDNPRKDYFAFKYIEKTIAFFYDEKYDTMFKNGIIFDEKIDKKIVIDALKDFLEVNNVSILENEWFDLMKTIALKNNFAINNKEYKENSHNFVGNMADFINIIRVAITGSKISPNLYCVLKILGKNKVANRVQKNILQLGAK
ncbi:MAG: glutamate--tRNA ligase [Bacilli bacterium]|nr:glutamate--tRNA ligase [Bacilli bacterium]